MHQINQNVILWVRMIMKKLLIYIFFAVFIFSGTSAVNAVQIDKKKAVTKKVVKKKTPVKPAKTVKKTPKKDKSKKYDKFVDKNKNGIDDRKENLKKKTTASKKKSDTKK